FQIDPNPFQARLNGAKAAQAQQQARLDNAQSLLARVIPLAEARAVAQKELDDAQALVAEASAALEGADAQVFEAELNLGYATIQSPVTGIAGQAMLRQGALVGNDLVALTEVARIDPMWVEFSIAETQLLQGARSERQGAILLPDDESFEVTALLSDGSIHPYTGRISFADSGISDRTGTQLFRAELPNPEGALRPGQFVRARISGAKRPNAIAIPQRAVQQGPQGAFVWLADANNQAEIRPVLTAGWIDDRWIIRSGLFEGDRVIVDGLVGLSNDAPIRPRLFTAEPDSTATSPDQD
ncbi:MAG: efflux RND transporter periplasmic adaptor subunit, partial [Pseudomonadota bacterium]